MWRRRRFIVFRSRGRRPKISQGLQEKIYRQGRKGMYYSQRTTWTCNLLYENPNGNPNGKRRVKVYGKSASGNGRSQTLPFLPEPVFLTVSLLGTVFLIDRKDRKGSLTETNAQYLHSQCSGWRTRK